MTPLDQLIAPWVERTPDRPAITSRHETLTYGELDRLANRFAQSFLGTGLEPGDRVGIHLPKGPRGIAAMLGTNRAGGVYVPIDPQSPAPRAALIAGDCGIRHMVVAPALLERWHAAGVGESVAHFFLCDEGTPPAAFAARTHLRGEVLAARDAAPARTLPGPDDLAYMLYTSGSTGVPKGVMLSQRNALAFIEWAGDLIGLGPDDRVASHAPFHFDLSVFDIYSTLRAGGTVVILDETLAVSGRGMVDKIHDAGITVWYSVPSALVLMLEQGGLETRGATGLRAVYFAGEVFPVKYLRRTMSALPQARFFNLFGPTETNVCLYYEVPAPPAEDADPVPAGYVACGDAARVLDPEGREVAAGEKGELFIDGPTVMLGYWDGGKRTPARHPYATGDLVSARADGALIYHGRRDHMIKVRGYRVELGEVEAAVYKHTSVKDAVVFAHEQRLSTVIVPTDGSLSVLDLKRHCAALLPGYMVPHDVWFVTELPRTSTGKIDRVKTKESALAGTLRTRGRGPADAPRS